MFKKLAAYFKSPSTVSKLLVVIVGITFYVLLQNAASVRDWLREFFAVFSPVLWGVIIAYLLNPIAGFFEDRVFKKMKKRRAAHSLATVIAFVLSLAALVLMIAGIVPQLISSVRLLVSNLQGYFDSFKAALVSLESRVDFIDIDVDELIGTWSGLFTAISDWVIGNLDSILDTSVRVGSGLFNFFVALIMSIYILLDKDNLKLMYRRFSRAYFKESTVLRTSYVVGRSNKILMSFVGGNIIDSLIVGLVNFIVMTIFGWPYPLLISVIVAVTNIIPTFGPIIGAIPCLLIILLVNPIDALWFLILTVVLQLLDGNLIKPLLFGDSTGLRPLWVLVAIVVGGGLFGMAGMLLGIPAFAIISFLLEERIDRRLEARGYCADGDGSDAGGNTDGDGSDTAQPTDGAQGDGAADRASRAPKKPLWSAKKGKNPPKN